MKITVEIDGQQYEVNIEDVKARPVVAIIEGERYEVWPESEDSEPQTSSQRPVASIPDPAQPSSTLEKPAKSVNAKDITSPLPGVIVAILAKPGDQVNRGQELCTLEAMKMKNAIKSTRDGKIASVEVNVGDQVGHGQILMTFTD